ncbi:MAG: hypothetical protein ACFB20_08640 [Opitutales bacterium]
MPDFVPRHGPLPLQVKKGWKQVRPRTTGKQLIWDEGQDVFCAQTDFAGPRRFPATGGVDCPIATHAGLPTAYRYCCQMQAGQRDFSELRGLDTLTGEMRTVYRLAGNQWMVWLCRLLKGGSTLLGLVATDARRSQLTIVHQLGFFDLKRKRTLLVPLPRDAYHPLAVCEAREAILFHGAEGYQLVNFAGTRLRRVGVDGLPLGRGASFHPERPVVTLGGGTLTDWDLDRGGFSELPVRGQFPLWAEGGRSLWFSQSSADLWHYDPASGEAGWIVRIAGYSRPEKNYSRALVLSADGRHLAAVLTRKVRIAEMPGAAPEPGTRLFRVNRCVVVLDLQARELWQHPAAADNLAWIEVPAHDRRNGKEANGLP